jgi:3-oxoacyl-[acyl-carrier protein] reductase
VALAAEKVNVALCDVNPDSLMETSTAVQAAGGKSHAEIWDLQDLDSIKGHIGTIEKALGLVDILINNTGGPPPTPATGQAAESWTRYFQSMVLPVIAITDCVLPGMRERGWGRVITSTSSGVVAPIPNLGMSNTLRLSLVGWSKTLSREVARDGVTANIVVPGRIATSRVHSLDAQRATREGRGVDQVIAESSASIPVGRYGEPQEYGAAVAFLASARASYINGSVIRVDGGLIPSI